MPEDPAPGRQEGFVGNPKRAHIHVKHSQRRTFVFASLVAFMSATGAILLALSPQPLAPDLPQSLLAVDNTAAGGNDGMDTIFEAANDRGGSAGAWRYIYVRHSKSAGGDTVSLMSAGQPVGDHFLICNGAGAEDGEIQITPRWSTQRAALPPAGAASIDSQCISICLVGDFDRNPPSDKQLKRLSRLVCALQARLNIPSENVVVQRRAGTPAAAGRLFPLAEFRSQILQ
jgi:hypothetical protein